MLRFRERGQGRVCNVTWSTSATVARQIRGSKERQRWTKPNTAALGHVTSGSQQKLCSFLLNGCFNDSKKLSLGHEIKHWDGTQQVSAIESTSSTPRRDITQVLNCEMCLSPQVNKDQNSIPGVQHSRVFLCAFFEILLQWGKKKWEFNKRILQFLLVSLLG